MACVHLFCHEMSDRSRIQILLLCTVSSLLLSSQRASRRRAPKPSPPLPQQLHLLAPAHRRPPSALGTHDPLSLQKELLLCTLQRRPPLSFLLYALLDMSCQYDARYVQCVDSFRSPSFARETTKHSTLVFGSIRTVPGPLVTVGQASRRRPPTRSRYRGTCAACGWWRSSH